jgi:hypothetical protein
VLTSRAGWRARASGSSCSLAASRQPWSARIPP